MLTVNMGVLFIWWQNRRKKNIYNISLFLFKATYLYKLRVGILKLVDFVEFGIMVEGARLMVGDFNVDPIEVFGLSSFCVDENIDEIPSEVILLGGVGIWLALVGWPILLADLPNVLLLFLWTSVVDCVRFGDAIIFFLLDSEAGAGICVARLVNPICEIDREGNVLLVVSDKLVGGWALKRGCDILELFSVWLGWMMDDERGKRELAVVEWLPIDEVEVDALG